jgi:uncharacterized Zn-binding protein involved in type VI secretion
MACKRMFWQYRNGNPGGAGSCTGSQARRRTVIEPPVARTESTNAVWSSNINRISSVQSGASSAIREGEMIAFRGNREVCVLTLSPEAHGLGDG